MQPFQLKHKMAILAAVVALCGAVPATAEVSALNQVDANAGFSDVSRRYSEMDATYVRNGASKRLQAIRQVAIGQTKPQVLKLTGKPLHETKDGAWYFNVNLALPQGNEIVCQYRVNFDAKERVSATIWRRPQCAQLVRNGRQG